MDGMTASKLSRTLARWSKSARNWRTKGSDSRPSSAKSSGRHRAKCFATPARYGEGGPFAASGRAFMPALQVKNARRGAIHSHAGTGTFISVTVMERED